MIAFVVLRAEFRSPQFVRNVNLPSSCVPGGWPFVLFDRSLVPLLRHEPIKYTGTYFASCQCPV